MNVVTTSSELRANGTFPGVPQHSCRFCGTSLEHLVVDLGTSPLCESYVTPEAYYGAEPFYALRAYVCQECFLVQVPELVSGEEIYTYYAYFSSYSESWLQHTRDYVAMAIERFGLNQESHVVEIASNDGYLLQYMKAQGISVLGVEPAQNVAAVALEKGIPTEVRFFGRAAARDLSEQGIEASLLIANNVIGHVPALNDFVEGLRILLASDGVVTIEIPHFLKTMEGNQFDQIYQEHYCYYSFLTMERVLSAHGLMVFDVDEIPTHGGSMRVYAQQAAIQARPIQASVEELRDHEIEAGLTRIPTYTGFGERVIETKRKLLEFLIQAKREGKRIAAYGAPGKGNTLLNYCGVREDFIEYAVDRNPYKQGKYMPGTRIPIYPPDKIAETRPDFVFLLPWNLKEELMEQLSYVREWGGRFVVPIPEPRIYE